MIHISSFYSIRDKLTLHCEQTKYKQSQKLLQEQELKYQNYIEECNDKYLKDEKLWEFETMQIFLSDGNPFEQAYDIVNDFSSYEVGDQCVIVGVVARIQKKKTKKGDQFAFANIYSGAGIVEIVLWPDALQKFQDLVVKGQQVAVLGKKDGDDKMIADKLKSYTQWLTDMEKRRKRRY